MRRWGIFLLSALVCALMVLGWSGLVQGPEGTPVERTDMRIPEHPEICAEPVRANSGALPLLPDSEEVQIGLTARTEDIRIYMPEMPADRNGQPMTSRTWWRAVYLSCAPEGLPG